MLRSIRVLGPSVALFAVFTACGGTSDPGLFSGSGGSSAAGASSEAGAGTTPEAGSSSVAGSVNAGGDEAMGGDNSAGGSTGGATAGGAASGGDSSQAGSGEPGGSGGHAEGGGAGHSAGSSGGKGGTSAGGAAGAGSGGKGGNAGSAGGSSEPSCKDLLAQATTQLEAARACNIAENVLQCTGKVNTTCGCQVPVERSDSVATNAYEATLKQIQAKHCVQACPAIACAPVSRAQCRATTAGSTKGMCVASFPLPVVD
jgi:hypothetical protein